MKTTVLLLAAVLAAAAFSGCDSILLSRPPGTEPASHASSDPKMTGIWLLGGVSAAAISTTVSEVDLYDQAANVWYPAVTSLPTPVSFAGYGAYDGKLYVIGGFNAAGVAQTAVQIYNVASNTWSSGSTLPLARANIFAAQKGDRFLVLGGTAAAASAGFSGSVTTYDYNAPGNSWTAKVNYGATNLYDRAALAFDDAIYNFGGRSAVATMVTTHDAVLYSPNVLSTGVTEVVLSAARTQMASVLTLGVNGIPAATGGTVLNTVQYLAYPFAAPSAWTAGTNFPVPIACASALVLGDRAYVFGGVSSMPPTGTSQAYSSALANPASLAWTTHANMPRQRYGHGAVTLNQ